MGRSLYSHRDLSLDVWTTLEWLWTWTRCLSSAEGFEGSGLSTDIILSSLRWRNCWEVHLSINPGLGGGGPHSQSHLWSTRTSSAKFQHFNHLEEGKEEKGNILVVACTTSVHSLLLESSHIAIPSFKRNWVIVFYNLFYSWWSRIKNKQKDIEVELVVSTTIIFPIFVGKRASLHCTWL